MILVVGSTGILGSEVCRRLRERGLEVRALVRPGSPRQAALAHLGVEICHGDLRSGDSLATACRGVRAVISTATAMGSKDRSLSLRAVDRDGQLALVAAAREARVEHFTFISLSPNLRPTAPLVRYKHEVERAVRASGMRWTILQPSVFADVWLSAALGWDHAAGRATIFGAGTAPLSWITVDDVAEHAVRSLDDRRLWNQALPLGGPDALPPNAVLRLFEEFSGRSYKARRVPRPVLAALAPAVALVDEGVASGMGLGAQMALGDVIDSPLQRELGLPLTSVREYAERVIRALA